MNRRIFTSLAAALLLTGTAAFAQTSTWAIDKAHSQADFQIRHMGISNVRGTISGIVGTFTWDDKDVTKSSVSVTLDANTVNTSTEARDKHLKSPDFFNVEKYPTITFTSTSVARTGDGKLSITGNLTLAGVTKPVTLAVDGPVPPTKGMGGKIVTGFSATGTLKRSDFNFGPKFAPPVLGDEVQFTIDAEAAKQ
jgi:polyisoprenoid-binding protein YceI